MQRAAGAGETLPAANLLEAMLLARDEDDPKLRLDDEEIFANAVTILLAGEDTTSNTAAWLLDAQAREPEVAAALHREVDATLEARSLVDDLDLLGEMPYLNGAVHEALRLRSAAPIMFLETLEDQQLGDLWLPEGGRSAVEEVCKLIDASLLAPGRHRCRWSPG